MTNTDSANTDSANTALPDFGLEEAPGGIVSPYSDGTPTIAYALLDAGGQVLRSFDAEREFYSASTVKLGVLIAALREVQSGSWSLSDEWTVTHEFRSVVAEAGTFQMEDDETDPGLGEVGDTVSLGWVLNRMTTVSANCATNMCFEALGAEKIAAVSNDAGAPDTRMGRPYSDEAGLNAGVSNTASALGLARLMSALVRGELLNAEFTAYAMDLLYQRTDPVISSAAGQLASETGLALYTGGKGGSVDGIKHDVAFVQLGDETYSLAVCTRAYSVPQGAAAIHALAYALLQEASAASTGVNAR